MTRRIKLPFKVKGPILACGADMKGAFALARGNEAFLVDGFGDLSDLDNFTKYEKSVKAHVKKLGINPVIIACDLHPDYFSSKFAERVKGQGSRVRIFRVQHHEAHIASTIVDNNIEDRVIGAAFDGTGYGSDGNIWGGEFFIGSLKNFKRVAHLKYIAMPGGEKAIKEPWRMAASYLYQAYGNRESTEYRVQSTESKKKRDVILEMIDKKINCPLTSSAGRLFDAAGSLILAKGSVSKEAELPIELERLIPSKGCGNYKFRFRPDKNGIIIDTKEIMKGVVEDLSGKAERSEISCKFHNTMANLIAGTVSKLSKKFKIKNAVLSGGVFQNKYLTAKSVELLTAEGIKVYTHSNIATNDSGIPLGQIAIANTRLQCA